MAVLAILFAACTVSFAQTGPAGTWRVDGVGQSLPWELVLKTDGTMPTGAVNSCASVQNAFPIYEGTSEGNKVSFKCMSGDGQRTITFAGTVGTDQIAFAWELQNQNPDPPFSADGTFGNSAPRRFTAKRIPDDDFTKRVNHPPVEQAATVTPGNEFAASVNLIHKGVKAEGRIFIPGGVRRVQSVSLVIGWGRGFDLYDDPKWRQLALTLQSGMLLARITPIDTEGRPVVNSADRGGVESVLALLPRLAQESLHPELSH